MASKVSYIIQLKDQFSKTAAMVKRSFAGIKKGADKAQQSVKSFVDKSRSGLKSFGASSLKAGAVMTAAVTVPIALMAKSMVNAASDAVETGSKFDAIFSGIKGKANQVAAGFAKDFGLANSTAKKMIGNTGDLLVGFGFTGDSALEMANKVAVAASDLAAFQNFEGGAEGAAMSITKALLGEAESMKSLGVVVSQNSKEFKDQVKAVAAANKITVRQAKALVIFKQIQDQTKTSVGNVKDTWNDYAAVANRAEQTNLEMRESFGKILIPIATKFTIVLIKLSKWFTNLSAPVKKLILVLAGVVAIGGPLLILLGGIALAVSVISAPLLLLVGAVLAFGAAAAWVSLNWETVMDVVGGTIDMIGTNFGIMWDSVKTNLVAFVNFYIEWINKLATPISFISEKLGMGKVEIKSIGGDDNSEIKTVIGAESKPAPVMPKTPSPLNNTLSGQIVVSATGAATVERTSMATTGPNLDLGMNM